MEWGLSEYFAVLKDLYKILLDSLVTWKGKFCEVEILKFHDIFVE